MRADSRFCSSTCRVRAYRERVAADQVVDAQAAAEPESSGSGPEEVAATDATAAPVGPAHELDPVDDGLVFCERCRRRVPPEVRRQHVHGTRTGVIRVMTEEDEAVLERPAAPDRWWEQSW